MPINAFREILLWAADASGISTILESRSCSRSERNSKVATQMWNIYYAYPIQFYFFVRTILFRCWFFRVWCTKPHILDRWNVRGFHEYKSFGSAMFRVSIVQESHESYCHYPTTDPPTYVFVIVFNFSREKSGCRWVIVRQLGNAEWDPPWKCLLLSTFSLCFDRPKPSILTVHSRGAEIRDPKRCWTGRSSTPGGQSARLRTCISKVPNDGDLRHNA